MSCKPDFHECRDFMSRIGRLSASEASEVTKSFFITLPSHVRTTLDFMMYCYELETGIPFAVADSILFPAE